MTATPPEAFIDLVAAVSGAIENEPIDADLADLLMRRFPPGGATFENLAALCRQGCAEGWLCNREAGGIRYGRALKPSRRTHDFSVDVVEMDEIAGPHHRHPNGEIDMIMPLDERAALFDGAPKGWKVYGPGSEHQPTVTSGRALILYLLPQGAIEFTRA